MFSDTQWLIQYKDMSSVREFPLWRLIFVKGMFILVRRRLYIEACPASTKQVSRNCSMSYFGMHWNPFCHPMGLLPDTQNCECACAGNAGNVFPVTAGKRSRHASWHVRHARAVMHAGIANLRIPLKSAAGENVPGIPGACATCKFTYLVRGPWTRIVSWWIKIRTFR